ncbi:phage integrase [Propionigenium maris DSM 9537]|uniref:Phage integrase n=1 Tax=Propionigenium maris DSM 9537 TaxID=1123000 RepID=A0A9W6GNF5_9FUSO|nr:site-specific integrase [Propionigenium maris]GLI57325.1 phage integrase [Propionigenium maris DSM 9537]
MPVYKDGKKWRVVYTYKERGVVKQSQKRGFLTKREAKLWESEYKLKGSRSVNMTFASFYKLYMADVKPRVEDTTYHLKEIIFQGSILPYFNNMKMSKITPIIVRDFQNRLITGVNPRNGRPYKAHYIQKINAQLSALMNHAVNFYELSENPCKKAGPLKLRYEKKVKFWTLDEFNRFVKVIEHKPMSYIGFHVLFWTGIRTGELLALSLKDIDLINGTIKIDKSYARLNGKDIIKSTKNESSERVIKMPKDLVKLLKKYIRVLYGISSDGRLFNMTREVFKNDLSRYCHKAGVKKVTPHDLRHSHASLLINEGVNPLAISKRLGHAKVDMTLNTYSHLYQSTEDKMVDILDAAYGKVLAKKI